MRSAIALLVLPCLAVAFPPRGDPFSPLGPWSKKGPPCGLPSWLEKLPEDAQNKIKAIWANYVDGNDCDAEHKQTREILHELPDEVREAVFAGKCGPTFLRNVSATVRKEFRAVWFDHRLKLDIKELALKKLAYSLLNGESLALFNKWEEELQVRKAEYEKKVAALSPEARQAFDTWKEMRMKEKDYLAALPKEIREELRTLCGFRFRKESTTTTTEEPTTTTEGVVVEETTQVAEVTTTAAPLIEEKAKEKEFAQLLDVTLPEEFNDEVQCSYYH